MCLFSLNLIIFLEIIFASFSSPKNFKIFSMSSLFNLLIASFAENSLRPIIILSSPNELNDNPFFGSFI